MKHTQLFSGAAVAFASAVVGACSRARDGGGVLAFLGEKKALSAALSRLGQF